MSRIRARALLAVGLTCLLGSVATVDTTAATSKAEPDSGAVESSAVIGGADEFDVLTLDNASTAMRVSSEAPPISDSGSSEVVDELVLPWRSHTCVIHEATLRGLAS